MAGIEDGEDGDVDILESIPVNPLELFEKAKLEKRPLYTAAPMVRYSKLAFRQTVTHYGVDLCWTPMILAKEFNRSSLARDSDLTLSPSGNPPTIVQFGVNSPEELSRATTLVSPYVSGIDINCGCPQSWACAENLGAALMHKRELVASMVKAAKSSLGPSSNKTVSAKIRIHKDLRETIDFVKTVEAAGADFITIHGRMRSTPSSIPVNLEAIKLVTSHTTVPTLLNGDIFTLSSAHESSTITGVSGVMAARGLLQNPALFAGYEQCPWEAVETFMNYVVKAPVPFKLVVHHLSEMVGSDWSQKGNTLWNKEERVRLMGCKSLVEVMDFLDGVSELSMLAN